MRSPHLLVGSGCTSTIDQNHSEAVIAGACPPRRRLALAACVSAALVYSVLPFKLARFGPAGRSATGSGSGPDSDTGTNHCSNSESVAWSLFSSTLDRFRKFELPMGTESRSRCTRRGAVSEACEKALTRRSQDCSYAAEEVISGNVTPTSAICHSHGEDFQALQLKF